MNKKNKIITTALGAGVLGSGIALTAIAQACTDDSPAIDPQQEEAINTITTELNAVTSYREGDIPDGILWELLRLAINDSDSAAVNVLEWNFSTISAEDISVSGYDYTVQLNNFQGLFNDGQVVMQATPSTSVSWVLRNRNVNDSIGQLALRTVSLDDISASRQNDQTIIAEVNTLSNYNVSTSQPSGLALELLTAIESNITGSYPFGALTLSTLTFSELNSSRVFPFNTSGENNIYSINIDIASGVAASGTETISVAGSMIIAVEVSNINNFAISATTGVTGVTLGDEALRDTIRTAVNQFSNYDSMVGVTDALALAILPVLNSTIQTVYGEPSATLLTLNFNMVTSTDTLISPSSTNYNIGFISITSATISTDSGPFTINDINFRITIGANSDFTLDDQNIAVIIPTV